MNAQVKKKQIRWTGFAYVTAFVLAIMAACILVLCSFVHARNARIRQQQEQLTDLSNRITHQCEEIAAETVYAEKELAPKSSQAMGTAEDIRHLGSVMMRSPHLVLVGRVDGTEITCTSLGKVNPPLDIGVANVVTKYQRRIWLHLSLGFAGNAKCMAIEYNGVITFFLPGLATDVYTDQRSLSTAVVTYSERHVLMSTGLIRPEWLQAAVNGPSTTFIDEGYIVAISKSRLIDTFTVVAQPISEAYVNGAAVILTTLPLGILLGALTAFGFLKSARKQLTMPLMLKAAIRNHEFFMNYQPIFDLRTHSIVGAEALIRWRRGTGEIIRPDVFLSVAKDMSVLDSITDLVVEMVMPATKQLQDIDKNFQMSMNISSEDVRKGKIVNLVRQVSERNRVNLNGLSVEITETGLLDAEQSDLQLRQLRAEGIKIAIDDFGLGYSSLAYLMHLDADCLKIDKLFVDAIGKDAANSHVIDHIIEMAKTLRMEIIAEGIETEEQAMYLTERGVRFGQGFHLGKPMPLDRLIALVRMQQAQPVKARVAVA